jgi:predicted alpha/beta-fold hydrolase
MSNKIKRADFNPGPGMRGAHAQSILASAQPRIFITRRRAARYRSSATDILIDCGDGVRLLGRYNEPDIESNGRLAVLIHGWEGSSDSVYNLSLGLRLRAEGYATLRLNLRDHGDSHHLNEELFHSCRLPEVVGAFRWINRNYPHLRVSIIGFSLGGNFALRVAAQAGEAGIELERVVAICPVLDPRQTMKALEARNLYEKYFIRKWRRSLEKKKIAFPHTYDFHNLTRFVNLFEMTDYFVTRYTDYADIETYLRGYTITGDRLARVQVPATLLLADDDPVIPIHGLQGMTMSDAVDVYRSAVGGHCGFLQDLTLKSWLDEFVLKQLQLPA